MWSTHQAVGLKRPSFAHSEAVHFVPIETLQEDHLLRCGKRWRPAYPHAASSSLVGWEEFWGVLEYKLSALTICEVANVVDISIGPFTAFWKRNLNVHHIAIKFTYHTCLLSFVCVQISGYKQNNYCFTPFIITRFKHWLIYFFSQMPRWHSSEVHLMKYAWFMHNHGTSFKQCILWNAKNGIKLLGPLYKISRRLLGRGKHWLEGNCCCCYEDMNSVWKLTAPWTEKMNVIWLICSFWPI